MLIFFNCGFSIKVSVLFTETMKLLFRIHHFNLQLLIRQKFKGHFCESGMPLFFLNWRWLKNTSTVPLRDRDCTLGRPGSCSTILAFLFHFIFINIWLMKDEFEFVNNLIKRYYWSRSHLPDLYKRISKDKRINQIQA